MQKKYKVLHITPHMGAGVGRALSNLSINASNYDSKYEHHIILLEEQQNKQSYNECRENGISVEIITDFDVIAKQMNNADIVQVEWWHHPLISYFLANFPQVKTRLLFWCHISGNNYPLLPASIVKRPHRFLFTSLSSYDNPSWTTSEKLHIKETSDVVNSCGNLESFFDTNLAEHDGFNIGYVGTQNYCRLHPDFVDMCNSIDLPNSKFVMIGDNTNIKDISEKAKLKGILDKFEFKGYVNDVEKQLSQFDVFAYPMNPYHYGTTENAIVEAMAVGLPVVLFNQCCEKYIVKHQQTGLLVDTQDDYVEAVKFLYNNPNEAKRLGQNAKEYVGRKYSIKNTIEKFEENYDSIINEQPRFFSFDDIIGSKPYQWILSCLNEEKYWFLKSIEVKTSENIKDIVEVEAEIANSRRILREPTKFSVFHYFNYFKDDDWLSYWADILNRVPFDGKY